MVAKISRILRIPGWNVKMNIAYAGCFREEVSDVL